MSHADYPNIYKGYKVTSDRKFLKTLGYNPPKICKEALEFQDSIIDLDEDSEIKKHDYEPFEAKLMYNRGPNKYVMSDKKQSKYIVNERWLNNYKPKKTIPCNYSWCEKNTSKKCGRCLKVGYCGKKHQILDWKSHKKTCIRCVSKPVSIIPRNSLVKWDEKVLCYPISSETTTTEYKELVYGKKVHPSILPITEKLDMVNYNVLLDWVDGYIYNPIKKIFEKSDES